MSAGLLLYRQSHGQVEVFLVHPGGPFWAKKDDGAWSIPKGQFPDDEEPLAAAQREFKEETGFAVTGPFQQLGQVTQASGKIVYAWAVNGNVDAAAIKSNTFSLEWPPGSGKTRQVPEVDRAGWFSINIAKKKILKSQTDFLNRLEHILADDGQA